MPVRVIIVDDHPVFLAGLRALLEMNKDIEIIGQATNGLEAIQIQRQLLADIVVMDINMPGMNGIEATREILAVNPNTKVLALSIHSGKRFVKGMLEAGASGYLLKGAVPEELILAIQKLAKGDMYLSSAITSIALRSENPRDEKVSVLSTKFHRPRITKEHVKRNDLIDFLNENRYKPATLVSAGAGYGKSILISSWLEECKTPYVWISLSEDENDFRGFMAALSASVRKTFPNALSQTNDLIEAASSSQINIISECLINDLDEITEEFVMVLDDFHLIQNKDVNFLINKLLSFPPQLMHLVIITRRDPYLDLSSLRAYSRINIIRMSELCFNESAIIELFQNLLSTRLSNENADKLLHQTEGWIAGLRLVSLLVKSGEDANEVFKNIRSHGAITSDFLLEEVIQNQPVHIQNFLVQASILKRFCAEIVDEVFLSQDEYTNMELSGKEIIQTLISANLFTISLDYEGKWFRFHHLFQELLHNQFKKHHSSDEIHSYHLKASEWYDKNNFIEEAVHHALKANEIDSAVSLIDRCRYELLNTEQLHRLNHLVNFIPEDVVEKTPALLCTKAFYMDFLGMVPEMIEYTGKAKVVLKDLHGDPPARNAINGEIETLEGVFYIVTGEWEKLIGSSKRALDLLPENAERIMSNALGYQVVGNLMKYDGEKGRVKVRDLMLQFPLRSKFTRIGEPLWYSLVYAMKGNAVALKEPASKLISLGEKYNYVESVIYGRFFLAYAHFMSNEFDKAEPILKKVVDGSFVIRVQYVVQCAFMLAAIYTDRGEVEKANKLMDFAYRQSKEVGSHSAVDIVKAMQAELAIKANDIENATLLYEHKDYNAILPPMWFPFIPQFIPIKLKLAGKTPEGVLEAQHLLTENEDPIRQTNKKSILIEILILQAVAFKLQNNDENALVKIIEALSLSSKGDYIRSYIDNGIHLKGLIAGLADSSEYKSHIVKILKAMEEQGYQRRIVVSHEPLRQSLQPAKNDAIPDALSFRELEVLKLVAQGLRNKEVSEQLFIQTDTVKKHLKSIFEKLDVPNRIKAAIKAEELGLIGKMS